MSTSLIDILCTIDNWLYKYAVVKNLYTTIVSGYKRILCVQFYIYLNQQCRSTLTKSPTTCCSPFFDIPNFTVFQNIINHTDTNLYLYDYLVTQNTVFSVGVFVIRVNYVCVDDGGICLSFNVVVPMDEGHINMDLSKLKH